MLFWEIAATFQRWHSQFVRPNRNPPRIYCTNSQPKRRTRWWCGLMARLPAWLKRPGSFKLCKLRCPTKIISWYVAADLGRSRGLRVSGGLLAMLLPIFALFVATAPQLRSSAPLQNKKLRTCVQKVLGNDHSSLPPVSKSNSINHVSLVTCQQTEIAHRYPTVYDTNAMSISIIFARISKLISNNVYDKYLLASYDMCCRTWHTGCKDILIIC